MTPTITVATIGATPNSLPTPLSVSGSIQVASGSIQTTQPLVDVALQIALVSATLLLAFFTAFLFRSTRDVARQTAEVAKDTLASAKLADLHHQESLLPIPIVVNGSLRYIEYIREAGGNAYERPAITRGQELALRPGDRLEPRLKLYLLIKNIGLGPALNVKIISSSFGYSTLTCYRGNIGVTRSNDEADYVDIYVVTPERPEFKSERVLSADITIEFENVFFSKGSASFVLGPEGGLTASTFKPPLPLDRGILRSI